LKNALNILFLFAVYPEEKNGNFLTKDLPDELALRGENVYVATIRERRLGLPTSLSDEYGKKILRVRTGNMFNGANKIEKGLTTILMNRPLLLEIKKHWGDIKFDLVIGTSPYTANHILIKGIKEYFRCPAFLILWDLYPQNAKDLGFIKNKLLFNLLKKQEVKSIKQFDFIGCMSNGNINYIKENYDFIDYDKLFLFPLWANKHKASETKAIGRNEIGYKENDFIAVFGGSMGIPQNLSNIISLANKVKATPEIKFLFIGEGSESNNIKHLVQEMNLTNVKFIGRLDRAKYESIMSLCDVGLVSLHPDFTVPNFPSKTIEYLKYGLPILATLDRVSLNDYGNFIQDDIKVGLCSFAKDITKYEENLFRLLNDKALYIDLSNNAKKSYVENFDIQNNCNQIVNKCKTNILNKVTGF
jgi:glycosyltransferase involved in cell wall biosynthesis